jgi:hypothetical protein
VEIAAPVVAVAPKRPVAPTAAAIGAANSHPTPVPARIPKPIPSIIFSFVFIPSFSFQFLALIVEELLTTRIRNGNFFFVVNVVLNTTKPNE